MEIIGLALSDSGLQTSYFIGKRARELSGICLYKGTNPTH